MKTHLLKLPPLLGLALALSHAGCETARTDSIAGEPSRAALVDDSAVTGERVSAHATEGAGSPEGIARVGGNYFYVHNGSATLVTQRERFAGGATFERDGRVFLQDGSIARLRAGEMVTFTGDRLEVPPGLQIPAAPTASRPVRLSARSVER